LESRGAGADPMTVVREPAVAGRFYPTDPEELRATIRSFLAKASPSRTADSLPKAIIAPHAGYVYSGPIAASAYSALNRLRGRVRRVVLFGPAHYVRLRGMALPSADVLQTPLGSVQIDRAACERVLTLPHVVINDSAHAREHSLEVHLPFLQEVLGDFQVVPLAVGEATAEEASSVIELLWGGEETLFVVSSDLSHFHDYETAARVDSETARLIESLETDKLNGERCCGFRPIGGLLESARRRGLSVRNIDLRSSGDTAGSRDRVVGYGAFVLEEARPRLETAHRHILLDVAEKSIRGALDEGREIPVTPNDYPERLQMPQASFVTLHVGGRLRGCMGSLEPTEPLVVNVGRNAYAAAFRDPRFSQMTRDELPGLEIHLSLLSPPEQLSFESEAELLALMRPGIDGLTLFEGGRRGTLLPSVWKSVTDTEEFLRHLKRKAGLGPNYWSDTIRVERYTTESIGRDL
jgi:AmmeMemoRadiSam system protein B/AmmeMemoRadiSam system protein A